MITYVFFISTLPNIQHFFARNIQMLFPELWFDDLIFHPKIRYRIGWRIVNGRKNRLNEYRYHTDIRRTHLCTRHSFGLIIMETGGRAGNLTVVKQRSKLNYEKAKRDFIVHMRIDWTSTFGQTSLNFLTHFNTKSQFYTLPRDKERANIGQWIKILVLSVLI